MKRFTQLVAVHILALGCVFPAFAQAPHEIVSIERENVEQGALKVHLVMPEGADRILEQSVHNAISYWKESPHVKEHRIQLDVSSECPLESNASLSPTDACGRTLQIVWDDTLGEKEQGYLEKRLNNGKIVSILGINGALRNASVETLERIIAHELGHALNLGHEVDPNSIMYYRYAKGVYEKPLAAFKESVSRW